MLSHPTPRNNLHGYTCIERHLQVGPSVHKGDQLSSPLRSGLLDGVRREDQLRGVLQIRSPLRRLCSGQD